MRNGILCHLIVSPNKTLKYLLSVQCLYSGEHSCVPKYSLITKEKNSNFSVEEPERHHLNKRSNLSSSVIGYLQLYTN